MTTNDETSRRLHPRLRCLKNGAGSVNLLRSDISSTVATAPSLSAETLGIPANLDLTMFRESLPIGSTNIPRRVRQRLPKRPKLATQHSAGLSYVNVFVELFRDRAVDGAGERSAAQRIKEIVEAGQASATTADKSALGGQVLVRRNFVAATVPIAALAQLEADPDIAFVHPSEPLAFDRPVVTAEKTSAPSPRIANDAGLRKLIATARA